MFFLSSQIQSATMSSAMNDIQKQQWLAIKNGEKIEEEEQEEEKGAKKGKKTVAPSKTKPKAQLNANSKKRKATEIENSEENDAIEKELPIAKKPAAKKAKKQ